MTHRSKLSFRGGYFGSGSRGASEKYPSREAASSARSAMVVLLWLYCGCDGQMAKKRWRLKRTATDGFQER